MTSTHTNPSRSAERPGATTPGDPPPRSAASEDAGQWQLRMFSKSFKKRQKLELLLRQIGDVSGLACLLVTNGDNNGALNHHFRAHGGRWTWVELEEGHLEEMERLLGERVLRGEPSRIPVPDASQDVVVSIDVHEHLEDCRPLGRELRRVTRPGGMVVVTTPNGDERKLMTKVKNLAGMTKEKYGHAVVGYDIEQHETMLGDAGLVPEVSGSYSWFFTELVEFGINLLYMAIRSRRRVNAEAEGIAPVTDEQFRSVAKQYRVYSLVYPLLWLVTRLDVLAPGTGYAVSVQGRRPREDRDGG